MAMEVVALSYRRFGGLLCPEDKDNRFLINAGEIPTKPQGVISQKAVSYHCLYVGVINKEYIQNK